MEVSSHEIISLCLSPDLSDPHTTQTFGCVGRGLFVPTLIFKKNFSPRSSLTAVFSFQLNRRGRGLSPRSGMQQSSSGEHTRRGGEGDTTGPGPHPMTPSAITTTPKTHYPDLSEFFFFFLTKLKNLCVCGVYKHSIPLLDLG